MALINCPECGREISDKAKKCPHCGMKLKKGFFQSHKLLTMAAIGGALLIGGAVTFFSTHTMVTYGENVAIKGVRQLEKKIINDESIDIEKLSVGYVYPNKLDGLLFEIEQENMKNLYEKDYSNVWIKYRFLDEYGSIEESVALVVLDKNFRTIYITTDLKESEDSVSSESNDIYNIIEIEAAQKQIKDYHKINLNKKNVKKALEGKNRLIVNSKYPDNKKETDRALVKMIKWDADNEGFLEQWYNRGEYCLENISSMKCKKEALEIRDASYYEYTKKAYKEAKKYREGDDYISEADELIDALGILDRTVNRTSEVEELENKCKSRLEKACYKAAKQTYQNIEYNDSDEEHDGIIYGLSHAIEYLDKIENKNEKEEELRAEYLAELEPLCYEKAEMIYMDMTEEDDYYAEDDDYYEEDDAYTNDAYTEDDEEDYSEEEDDDYSDDEYEDSPYDGNITSDISRMEEAVEAVNKIENVNAEVEELKNNCVTELDNLYYWGARVFYNNALYEKQIESYSGTIIDLNRAIEYLDKSSNLDDDSAELKAKCQKEMEAAKELKESEEVD